MRYGKKATNPIIAIYNDPNERIDTLRYQAYSLAVSDEIVEDIIVKNADFFSSEDQKKIVDFPVEYHLLPNYCLKVGGKPKR